jgi:hypothetical protein
MQSFASTFRGVSLRAERAPQKANVQTRRVITTTRASVVAEPATLDVKSVDGKSAGSAALSLKVASPETANGLVHRYVVMVRQNMRQVRTCISLLCLATFLSHVRGGAHVGHETRSLDSSVAMIFREMPAR